MVTLHEFLDVRFGLGGDDVLREMLDAGASLDEAVGHDRETPLHVATRRRRLSAVEILVARGAPLDAVTRGGKTAFAHAVRRGFGEVAAFLAFSGADRRLCPADEFAVAVVEGHLDRAAAILARHPGAHRTGNPEEDRLLPDMAGRPEPEAVRFLVDVGCDLQARGLDDGTALHQAAWFGQPANARILLDAGAPLEVFDRVHNSSPLGWAVHGSRASGDADARRDAYRDVVALFLSAGAALRYPDDPGDAYLRRLRGDATECVLALLPEPVG